MQKKISFGTINITSGSRKLIDEALDSGRVSSGSKVRKFEKKFAAITGTRESVAVSSGADADALALAVLYDFGARRGDEVIVPALSFVATGNAVLEAGFTPVFVDIESHTLNIDPGKIERAITKKTRAIMPVHLMGKPAKMDPINKLARKYRLYVIEDAAEAHGAQYNGRNAGTLGDMAAFSLYIAHIITTIEGGVVTTDNPEFASVLRSLRCHGRACKCPECLIASGKGRCRKRFAAGRDIRFVFERVGFSAKMNEIEAAVGLGSLECYRGIICRRRKNLKEMTSRLKEFEEFIFSIEEEPGEKIGPHAFPMVVRENSPFSRDQLTGYFSRNGIDTRDLFASMPTQCPGFAFLGYRQGSFPGAEFIGRNGLHIGVHQDLKPGDIDYIFEKLRAFIARKT